MTARKQNLDAEVERLRGEYESALAEVAAAEQSHEIEMRRLAGQKALGEISDENARQGRQALDADLAAKRANLALLRDAIPAVEARGRRRGRAPSATRGQAVRRRAREGVPGAVQRGEELLKGPA